MQIKLIFPGGCYSLDRDLEVEFITYDGSCLTPLVGAIFGGYVPHMRRKADLDIPIFLPVRLGYGKGRNIVGAPSISGHERLRYVARYKDLAGPDTSFNMKLIYDSTKRPLAARFMATIPAGTFIRVSRVSLAYKDSDIMRSSFVDFSMILPVGKFIGRLGSATSRTFVDRVRLAAEQLDGAEVTEVTSSMFGDYSLPDIGDWICRRQRGVTVIGRFTSSTKWDAFRVSTGFNGDPTPPEGTVIHKVKIKGTGLIRCGKKFIYSSAEHGGWLYSARQNHPEGWKLARVPIT